MMIRTLIATILLVPTAACAAEGDEFFESRVRPILVGHCYACHSEKVKGGLRMDSRDALLKGGDTGPALVPGKPEKTRLIEAITYKNVDLQMPPKGKLPEKAIADLTTWVAMGAPWPGSAAVAKDEKSEFNLAQRKARHWAWAPVQDPPIPHGRCDEPIDRFIFAKLDAAKLKAAPRAEPLALLRRIHFDITGLPPTPDEQAIFLKAWQASPRKALEEVVDKLLASQQYGERWARHWLDLVRYGESRGHEFEPTIPNAYQYRDYVIRAINADVPYDRFVTEHVAGDLLPQPRLNAKDKFNESVLGTGFWHLGEEVHSPVDIRADEADRFDNRIDVFSKTFLALTVSCARCHDHKFDAISTKDYYALYGFLRSSHYRQVRFDTIEHNREVMRQMDEERAQAKKAIGDAVEKTVKMSGLPDIFKEACESIARGKVSEKEAVRVWVTHLEKAAKDETDPMHLLAICAGKGEAERKKLLTGFADSASRKRDEYRQALAKLEVIVDYSRFVDAAWLADDASYGNRPAALGELRFGVDPSSPEMQLHELGAATIDPIWKGLKASPGTQTDHGALGANIRAGRTLHTPGFTIKSNQVHYLVRGNGKAYVSVDAHTVIAGPLHGKLIQNFNTAGKWKWISQSLTTYQGHQAHVEFSPNDEGEFAVAIVAQGESPPPYATLPNPLLIIEARNEDAHHLSNLQSNLHSLLFEALECPNSEVAKKEGYPQIYNWMLRNPGLFGVRSWDKVIEAAVPFYKQQTDLTARIRKESRLAPAMIDGSGYDERVFIRGSHKALGDVVPRRFLEALAGSEGIKSAGSGRLELAKQMVDPKLNPFVARVMANRVWHHLFGRGLVPSTDNFGELGEKPTHPELLDHLATRFVREGWSTKKLIREIILSDTYQMSSQASPEAAEKDPDNRLLSHARLRRLEGEAIRDSMLAASGRLNPTMYGPSVPVHLTPFLDGRGRPASGPIDSDGRRSLYIAVRRNFLSPMMLAFDTPSPFSTVGKRTVSNVPAQALILMNDPFVHQMADTWGKALAASTGTVDDRVTRMYQQAFTRAPREGELQSCREFLKTQADPSKPAAWAALAHVLFNVKEFIYVE